MAAGMSTRTGTAFGGGAQAHGDGGGAFAGLGGVVQNLGQCRLQPDRIDIAGGRRVEPNDLQPLSGPEDGLKL